MHCKAHSFALQDIILHCIMLHTYTNTHIQIYVYPYIYIYTYIFRKYVYTLHMSMMLDTSVQFYPTNLHSSMISPFTDHLEARLKKRTGWRTACPQQWQLPWMTTTLNTAGSVKWEQYASMAFTQTFTFGKKPFQSGRGKGCHSKR